MRVGQAGESFSRRFWCHKVREVLFVVGVVAALGSPSLGQFKMIYQEGFNDDGDGERYTMEGRFNETYENGPAMWEHNLNVDVIGLPALAAEKRAAILWTSSLIDADFTEDSLAIWENLIDYMIDGKEEATIGFFPDKNSETADFLSFQLEEAGHTTVGLDGQIPTRRSERPDLIIQSEQANPTPGGLFASFGGTGYPVPVITYNAGNHDDTLVSSIGAVTPGGPTTVTAVEEFKDHPILDGRAGEIPWLDEFSADVGLQGIGTSTPSKSKTLLTYEVDGVTYPGLVVVEKDDPLLGAFDPTPEGEGFIVGGDMNEPPGSEFSEATAPRVLQLNPVDISGETGVKMSIALAASDVDFDDPDFLRISYSETPDGEFTTLGQFDALKPPGVLYLPELGEEEGSL